MKNVFDTLTNSQTIQRIILAMIVIVIVAIIFTIVLIFSPSLQRIFPLARETVLSMSTAAMVLATLILALGTFKIIGRDREREDRSRIDKFLDEIIEWAENIQTVSFAGDASVITLKVDSQSFILREEIKNLYIKSKYLKSISESLDDNSKVLVMNLSDKLYSMDGICLNIIIKNTGGKSEGDPFKEYLLLKIKVDEDAKNIVEKSSSLKTALLHKQGIK